MSKSNDNSIFFLTISLLCLWLIVDYVVGKKYVGKFIAMLPFMGGDSTSQTNFKNPNTPSEMFGTKLTSETINWFEENRKKYDADGDGNLNDEEKKKYLESGKFIPNYNDLY